MTPGIPNKLRDRPMRGSLVVPFMVQVPDDPAAPVDFRKLDSEAIKTCAAQRRCGVCGRKIKRGEPIAFIGPGHEDPDGAVCFSDPWMHVVCAEYTARECPFVSGRRHEHRDVSDMGAPDQALMARFDQKPSYLWTSDHASVRSQREHWTPAMVRAAEAQGMEVRITDSQFHFEARGHIRKRLLSDPTGGGESHVSGGRIR